MAKGIITNDGMTDEELREGLLRLWEAQVAEVGMTDEERREALLQMAKRAVKLATVTTEEALSRLTAVYFGTGGVIVMGAVPNG